jgi:hypothetical protein
MRTFLVIPAAFALMTLAHAGEKPAKKHSQALSEGDRITIGGRRYALQFFKKGGLVGRVEKRGAFCLWREGKDGPGHR